MIDIDDRLASLGATIEHEIDRRAATNPHRDQRLNRRNRRRFALAAGGAFATAAVAVAIAVIAAPDESDDQVVASGQIECVLGEAAPVSASNEVLLPEVTSAPAWFGEPRPAFREGAQRTGTWTSAAIAIGDADELRAPIWIAASTGTITGRDAVTPVPSDEGSFEQWAFEDVTYVATTSTPTRVASGAVATDRLIAVLAATSARAEADTVRLDLGPLPEPYCLLVAPQPHGPDTAKRRTLASQDGTAVINEISDWTRPDLAAAATGADITRIDGPITAWTGITVGNPTPLRFLTWAPRPGTVFEITTTDLDRPINDLIGLATSTNAIPELEWNNTYRD